VKILVESPRGRAVYSDVAAAGLAIAAWLQRETAHEGRSTCAGITVSVHADDENCDHETEPGHA
jgi:hypothetical protein